MKAVLCEQYGGPEVLQMADDLPTPRVGPNGVLVQLRATSVNPVDWKFRQGLLDAVRPVVFPVIWGCDLSGVVAEVGPAVTLFKPGDEVYGFKDGYVAKTYRGTYAEYVVAPEKTLAKKPNFLRELGADLAIDYTRERIDTIQPKFDLVLDGVGKSVWPSSMRALKFGGRLVTLAVPIPEQPAGKLRFFATAGTGVVGGVARGLLGGKRLVVTRVKPRGGDLEKIGALIEAGKIRPVIEKVFPLEQIADAHRLSEQGHVRGKLAISIQHSAVSTQP